MIGIKVYVVIKYVEIILLEALFTAITTKR